MNDKIELIVIDGKFFKSSTEESDQRISDYLLENYFIIKWFAFKMYFFDEKKSELIYLVAIQVLYFYTYL